MQMPKFDSTLMATVFHVENGEQQQHPVDAIEALTNYPDEYKIEPWTEKEKAEFAKKPKSVATKETPRWRVKEATSINGTRHEAGAILVNYVGRPQKSLEPINDAARIHDANSLKAQALIGGQMQAALAAQAQVAEADRVPMEPTMHYQTRTPIVP